MPLEMQIIHFFSTDFLLGKGLRVSVKQFSVENCGKIGQKKEERGRWYVAKKVYLCIKYVRVYVAASRYTLQKT